MKATWCRLVLKVVCAAGLVWLIRDRAALALDSSRPIADYGHDVWQAEQGLPQNTIHSIVQTGDGYIWLATEEGLVRFDGIRFVSFDRQNTGQIKNNYIQALFEDREGALWVGTPGGLVKVKDGRFIAYGVKDGLAGDNVTSILEDSGGNLWVGTIGGLCRFDRSKFVAYTRQHGLPGDSVKSIYEDKEGSLWIGTTSGLARLKQGQITAFTIEDGLPDDDIGPIYQDRKANLWIGTPGGLAQFKDGRFKVYTDRDGLPNNRIWSILEDRMGALWIGTDGGLARFRGDRFSSYTTRDGLASNSVWSIYEDREGSLWTGTPGGLSRFKDGQFTSYTSRDGLSSDIVLSIYEDREGSLWIGTEIGGLNRLKDRKFTNYTSRSGLSSDKVWSVCQGSNNSLWIGSYGGGLTRFRNGKFIVYSSRDGLPSNIVRAICEDRDGSLWIGTPNGLARFRSGRFSRYTIEDGLSSNAVWSIEEDSKGQLWIGTLGGLTRFKDGEFTVYTSRDGLSDNRIISLCRSKDGGLWIGTRGGGINRFRNGKFSAYSAGDGLSDEEVRSIYEDRRGNLWVGTRRGGVNRFRSGRFIACTTRDGLFDDCIYQILEDETGNLWMCSDKGVFRASINELVDFTEGRIKRISCISYGTADGMGSSQCSSGQPAACKTDDGRLWFATSGGLAVIDPANIKINAQPPPVVIERVVVDNEPLEPNQRIEFSPGRERFEFHYAGLSFLATEKVRFKYRLDGFDREWVDAGTQRVAYYTNIPPGNYKFTVIACNSDGVWNQVGASFEFYLKPHFYQTYWFYIACSAVIALAVWGLYRLRVKQMKAQFAAVLAERNRLAREIHDTLAQGFVGIKLQLEACREMLSKGPQTAQQHLEMAHNIVGHSLAEVRRFIWDLRSQALPDGDLAASLSEFAGQLAAARGVRASVKVSGKERRLTAVVENNILRIGQEALTNAIKHAQAKQIQVELNFDLESVSLRVIDDGCGFDVKNRPSSSDGHFGLVGMMERAERIGGRLELESRPGEGTRVTLSVPYGKA